MPDRTRSAELAALTSIAAQVNCTQALDEILGGALETTLEVVGMDAGEIFLTDEETGDLLLRVQRGLSGRFVADEAALGPQECLCGLAATSKQRLVVSNIASHPARSRAACLREGFRSLLCLPLLARGQVLGLLNVQSRAAREFTADDEELLTAISNQIGIAVANARLIEDAEQRRATLDRVMTSLVDGLILVDRRGRISYVNPCAEEMLQVPATSLVGRSLAALEQSVASHVAGWDGERGHFQRAAGELDHSPIVEFSLTTLTAEDARPIPIRTVQARFFPIHGAGGEALGQGLLLRDITREKELDGMKSQLLSTVSHELRTPLASIKGFATTLLRQDVQWEEDTRREFLAIIDEESDRLSELIGNLLDMSRIESGAFRMEPEPTDLPPIVEETVAAFQVMTHDHHFRTLLPSSLPLVRADPRRVRQVLRNLLENAVKYSPGGGVITITVECVEHSAQISVSDQGLGIDPEYLDRIFDRFYQVDSASTRRVGGSGLGLSICKAIAEAHGGRIWVESQPAVGSTFYVSLPLEE